MEDLTNCPCGEKCSNGCPCPSTSTYDCDVLPPADGEIVSGNLSMNYPILNGDCFTYTWENIPATPKDDFTRATVKHNTITTWHFSSTVSF